MSGSILPKMEHNMVNSKTNGVRGIHTFIGQWVSLFGYRLIHQWIILAAIMHLSSAPVYAQNRTYRLGVLVDNYPFSFRDSVGEMHGFAYDLLQEIELKMGLRFERVLGTTEDINKAFRENKLDLLQSYARSNQRDSTTVFSVPYSSMMGQIFVRDKLKSVKSLDDLNGLRVLVHRGSIGEQILKKAGLESSITYVESVKQALILLNSGKGDATLATRLTGFSLAKQLGLKHLRAVDVFIEGYNVDYCIAVQKNNQVLLEQINEGLATLVSTGQFEVLYKRWFGFIEPIGYTTEQILLAVALGLVIALLIALWSALRQNYLKNRIARQAKELLANEIALKQMLVDLSLSKEKAEESDRLKTAFLQNISHEIRTPLNSIIGFSELLDNPDLTPEMIKKFTGCIVYGSEQLLSTIMDIINIATLEAGQTKVYKKEVDLNLLMANVHKQFQESAEKRHLEFNCSVSLQDTEVRIITDETLLNSILSNLIDNALKFTEIGIVTFGYVIKGDFIEFFIEDTGMGIALEMQTEIFGLFTKAEMSQKKVFGGTGLGLTLSKGYVELLGGQISMTSVLGKGSQFIFTLPYIKPDAPVGN